jgi:purine-binding chemotaxis protein CheW
MTFPLVASSVPSQDRTFCTFRLGDGLFGLDAMLVQSVNLPPPLTPLPHAPAAVCGYVNLRGQIHLILDLKALLKLGSVRAGPDTRLIVFKAVLGDPFGVLIDRVGGVVSLRSDQIEAGRPAETDSPADALVCGVGKLDGELITLLDAGKVLPAVERSLATGRRPTSSHAMETAS